MRPVPPSVPSPWPRGIAASLGVVVVANMIMLTFALRNPSVRVAEDPYADGLEYDQVMAERAASAALGWKVSLKVCPHGLSDVCRVELAVHDRDGRPVAGLTGSVEARRGDTAELDRAAAVAQTEGGGYVANLRLGQPGVYELSVRLEGDAAPWVSRVTARVGGAAP